MIGSVMIFTMSLPKIMLPLVVFIVFGVTQATKNLYCELEETHNIAKFMLGNSPYFPCRPGQYFDFDFNVNKSGPIGCRRCPKNTFTRYRNWCPECESCFDCTEEPCTIKSNKRCRYAVLPTKIPVTEVPDTATGLKTTAGQNDTPPSTTGCMPSATNNNAWDIVLVLLLITFVIAFLIALCYCLHQRKKLALKMLQPDGTRQGLMPDEVS